MTPPTPETHKRSALYMLAHDEWCSHDETDDGIECDCHLSAIASLRTRLAEAKSGRVADNERLHGHLLLLEEAICFALDNKSGWDLRARAMLDPFNRDAALAPGEPKEGETA